MVDASLSVYLQNRLLHSRSRRGRTFVEFLGGQQYVLSSNNEYDDGRRARQRYFVRNGHRTVHQLVNHYPTSRRSDPPAGKIVKARRRRQKENCQLYEISDLAPCNRTIYRYSGELRSGIYELRRTRVAFGNFVGRHG